MHMFEDSLMKLTKHSIERGGGWEYNGGGVLVQSAMYIYMELPQ
jgi:hypothetical protein